MGKIYARRDSEKSSTLTLSVKRYPTVVERSFNTLILSLQAMFRALSFMVLWWIPLVSYGNTLVASEAPVGSTIPTSSGCFIMVRTSVFSVRFSESRGTKIDRDKSTVSIVGDRSGLPRKSSRRVLHIDSFSFLLKCLEKNDVE